jgi:hypothetical protein
MYVYVWKDPHGIPFYVGMAKTARRFSPYKASHRNKQCLGMLHQIGPANVLIELHPAADEATARKLEQELILRFGRLCDGTGSLTNISRGGEFHLTSDKTKNLLKAKWQDPEHKEKILRGRKGVKRTLAPEIKQKLRERVAANPAMKGWGERNGKDPEFDTKRIAGIRAAQPKRAAKMTDPEALALRKARLKATLTSDEYKAKRALWDTPEYRQKLSDNKKAYWAKKRAEKLTGV